jgi:RND family efflux transporter MFP subunit
VAEVRVDVGDSVEAGTLLARLEAPATAARVRQAEEALARARAERRRADRDYARARRLHARQAATERRLDEARAAAEAARAATRRAKGALSEARAVLDRARVRAPARGRVREVHVDPGDLAAPGRPLLVLQTPGAAHLRAYVREGLATRIAVGDTLETRVPAASFEGAAVVERIAPAVDPRSRAFAIEVGLPADGRLLPGMFGRVEVPARARPTVWVPDTAIRRVGQLELVRARAGGGAWGLRHVTTGRTRGDEVEVLSGLEGGERVALGRGGAEP